MVEDSRPRRHGCCVPSTLPLLGSLRSVQATACHLLGTPETPENFHTGASFPCSRKQPSPWPAMEPWTRAASRCVSGCHPQGLRTSACFGCLQPLGRLSQHRSRSLGNTQLESDTRSFCAWDNCVDVPKEPACPVKMLLEPLGGGTSWRAGLALA